MIIKERTSRRLSKRARRLVIAAILALFALVVALSGPRQLLSKTAKNLGWGGTGWEQETGFSVEHVTRGVRNWVTALTRAETPPRLTIDLKFKYVLKLREKRAEALALGLLINEEDEFVPATLTYDGRAMRVKMRLKGDLTDHLDSRKWSFRIHVRNGDDLLGMRRFSIQHPLVRDYQAEPLFLESLRREDILVPRYQFVDVVINGEALGLMALEEHFGKELLESQRRRESVILRYDESDVWASTDHSHRGFDGPFDHFANAVVDVFGRSKVLESAVLSEHARVAGGLLRAWSLGELPASEVFDTERLGRYLAVCELWGAFHAVRWHNVRFAYDPIAARLEPIGYDGGVGEAPHSEYLDAEPWVLRALSDPMVELAYQATLARLDSEQGTSQLIEHLRSVEAPLLGLLHREFPLLRPFNEERLRTRGQRDHAKATRAAFISDEHVRTEPDIRAYARLAHAWRVAGPSGEFLEVANAIPRAVDVTAIHWVAGDGATSDFQLPMGVELPLRLPPLPFRGMPTSLLLPITSPHHGGESIEVELVAEGSDRVDRRLAVPNWQELLASPIPNPTLEAVLARHEFLRGDLVALTVEPGNWDVSEPLVTPKGANLTIPAGVTLRFDEGAFVCVRGSLDLQGTVDSPIVLEASSSSGWGGLIVLDAPRSSSWNHAVVRDTRGISTPDWHVDAGVTFHQSGLELHDCLLEGTHAEDALNLIRTTFVLDELHVRETISDAFDADFCSGVVTGGSFLHIGTAGGGDGIDVSGSQVQIKRTVFRGVSDKAVSVGEASEVRASGLEIEDVGSGLASKDGSQLWVTDSVVRGATTSGLIAYIKKPSYGAALIEAEGISFEHCEADTRVQRGSSIHVSGVEVTPEDLDVDELYSTTMSKPGTR